MRDERLRDLQLVEPRLVFPEVLQRVRGVKGLGVLRVRRLGQRAFLVVADLPDEGARGVPDLGMRLDRAVVRMRRRSRVGSREICGATRQRGRDLPRDREQLARSGFCGQPIRSNLRVGLSCSSLRGRFARSGFCGCPLLPGLRDSSRKGFCVRSFRSSSLPP